MRFKELARGYQFWSPVVAVGFITENLATIKSLELIINGEH